MGFWRERDFGFRRTEVEEEQEEEEEEESEVKIWRCMKICVHGFSGS